MTDQPYFLHSERLGFRTWAESDGDLVMRLWGDPDVTRLIGGPFSEEQVKERLQKEIASQQEHGIQYWPIFLLETGEHVGCCGLRPYKPEQNILEIGFHLRRKFWGQGLAYEAAQATIEYAFDVLNVEGLFAGHNPNNHTSKKLLTKLGFEYTHDEFYEPTGLNHPSYMLKREMPELNLKYTIGFCIHNNRVLMIHRKSEPNQHLWNGLGGKLEDGESPHDSIAREMMEEAGLDISQAQVDYVGIVTWDFAPTGMYAYIIRYDTDVGWGTKDTDEGLLEWKPLAWVVDKLNAQVVDNIPYFLPPMLETQQPVRYHCHYNGNGECERLTIHTIDSRR